MAELFDPFQIRSLTLKNRVCVSPMSQYRAKAGVANDWHFSHLSRFALGGCAIVFTEATAISSDGRRTHGDLGLWNDRQLEALKPITQFIKAEGAIAGIQLFTLILKKLLIFILITNL
jgi:2,4-dienoyl-CoA reductase-like NADH-dependent reductase (Old Yellow Enzyme family)